MVNMGREILFQGFVNFLFYILINEMGNGRIESADIARRKNDKEIVIFTDLHPQACWKVGVLQPPNFTMPNSSIRPLEFIRKSNLRRKCNFFHEMSLFPLAV